jgi:ADP-ribosylglycohydrolase
MSKLEESIKTKGSKLPEDYVEKVYSGWLGKVIGVRHGGNVEGWTYEKLERTFGEITDYLHTFKNFAADDDTNGTFTFLRSLEDFTYNEEELTPEQMGINLLNYTPDGHGFFWWGGYGKSTEHTAYLNLKNGIMAPRSGSIEQNGVTVAEQIGGQIFADGWGLIAPGNPKLAARYAEKMASVTHDGNGVYGAMFIAACIAQAFVDSDVLSIIESGLSVIPSDCEYTRVTREVMNYYKKYPNSDWRICFKFVQQNFGYDKYLGNCHIIPNSAVIVLSLLYGEGDFSKSINICNMCGWDTDCNVANVGTIIGVKNGIEGIPYFWREPINDFLCLSTLIGSFNITDLPNCASYIARFGYKIAGENPPEKWREVLLGKSPKCHFTYPGSTHAFRLDSDADWQVTGKIENSGENSLKVLFDKVNGGLGFRAYYQTYYRPEDFNDSRYDPSFSPILYPGQTVTTRLKIEDIINHRVEARLYVKDRNSDTRIYGENILLEKGQWTDLSYNIPSMDNVCLIEAGIEFIPLDGRKEVDQESLVAYIDFFDFQGPVNYSVSFENECMEKWNGLHLEVSQLTFLRGIWTLENGELSGSGFGEPAEAYTGDLNWTDYLFESSIVPKLGDYHNIQFRTQGSMRSYAVGLAPNKKVVLYKNKNGYENLVSADFSWSYDQTYLIKVEAVGNLYKIFLDGEQILEYQDNDQPYMNGLVGFSNFQASHSHYKMFKVKSVI